MISIDQLIFYLILVVGSILLLMVNWPRERSKKIDRSGAAAMAKPNLVEELIAGPTALGAAGQEWLDRLLVQQQSEQPEK